MNIFAARLPRRGELRPYIWWAERVLPFNTVWESNINRLRLRIVSFGNDPAGAADRYPLNHLCPHKCHAMLRARVRYQAHEERRATDRGRDRRREARGRAYRGEHAPVRSVLLR